MDETQEKAILDLLCKPNEEQKKESERYLEMFFHYSRIAIFKIFHYQNESIEKETIEFIKNCKNEDGGYGASYGYRSSSFETMFACQTLYMLNVDFYDEKTVDFIMSCYDGETFYEYADIGILREKSNRFLASSLISLVLLDRNLNKNKNHKLSDCFVKFLSSKGFRREKTENYVKNSSNLDGGFGAFPEAESHGAMCYTCLVSAHILDITNDICKSSAISYLAKRQTPSGGMNSRPCKNKDGCYGFWCFAGLKILNTPNEIDQQQLKNFLLNCFNENGFSHSPNSTPDIFHTLYVLLGLELLKSDIEKSNQIVLGIVPN